jgi:PTH1 family peptidyl-tRNA hydrolase
MSSKKLVVGLGNPGAKYRNTPHNLGFEVVDRLALDAGTWWKAGSCLALLAEAKLDESDLVLLKPQTYVNLSGRSVRMALEEFAASQDELLVVCDDLALPWGKIRIRRKGGAGGHNGLKSVIESLGNEEFGRVRLGILPEAEFGDAAEYVLNPIPREVRELADEMVRRGAEAVKLISRSGFVAAMNQFN